MKRGFGSDNQSGAHPDILGAILSANEGHAESYGADELTEKWNGVCKKLFGQGATSYFVFNGTAANVLGIGAFVQSQHAIIASDKSHLVNDECGAPEKLLGCKVISIPSHDAKLTPDVIKPFLIRRGDQHASQPRVISITQPTELGTVYSLREIAAIADLCREENLILHIDGARLVNAIAALGCTFADAVKGADVISLGGTKNGLLFGEAIVFLNQKANPDFRYFRKQAMQLSSKSRFIAAQFLEFLGTDLWLGNALRSNRMASRLSSALARCKGVEITQKTQANGVFVKIPREHVARLREHSFFYVWDEHTFECRLMTSWDTTEADVDSFVAEVEKI
ncbi:MAG: beta-eliminating lyase-related protein [Bdellovibrionota bacterium]